jgi:S1-C subfamily serine protease
MKQQYVTLLICALLTTSVNADGFVPAEHVPFVGLEQTAQHKKKTVFSVVVRRDKSQWIPIGTGFFLATTNGALRGITCKHVVTPALERKEPIFVGIDSPAGFRRLPCRVEHIDPKYDIAILWPQITDDMVEAGTAHAYIPPHLMGDSRDLVEGRGVLMPGYPLTLGNESDQNHPVVRYGIIAQYTGGDHFLIDGVASHGSSGSPVFSLKHDAQSLVGMVTSHVTDRITLIDENGNMTAQLPYNSGLARALSIEVIEKVLHSQVRPK